MVNTRAKAPRSPKSSRPPLVFAVWQFVRIMVRLEKVGLKSAAYRKWKDEWEKLDRRLQRLSRANAAAYWRLMTDEEVVITDPGPAESADALRALDHVIGQMNVEMRKVETDDETIRNLGKERDALVALRARIRAEAPPPKRPAGKRPARRRPGAG